MSWWMNILHNIIFHFFLLYFIIPIVHIIRDEMTKPCESTLLFNHIHKSHFFLLNRKLIVWFSMNYFHKSETIRYLWLGDWSSRGIRRLFRSTSKQQTCAVTSSTVVSVTTVLGVCVVGSVTGTAVVTGAADVRGVGDVTEVVSGVAATVSWEVGWGDGDVVGSGDVIGNSLDARITTVCWKCHADSHNVMWKGYIYT